MSVQFGICNLDGKPVDPEDLNEVRPVLAPYGPDGEGYLCKDNLGILYRAFFTTKESRREVQPHVSQSGAVLTWDGRLDNREELVTLLEGEAALTSTDLAIAVAAFERWGTDSFAKLVGDWALSVWDSRSRRLILAKDFIGIRHLYYSIEKDHVRWSTVLDPLVLFADHSFGLDKEYVAGCLAAFPAAQLTPYLGIHSVPPSSFVNLTSGTRTTRKYWDFDPCRSVRYNTDAEYEENFRAVFVESVRRRLRSCAPVLAELSGGLDSSSIVCVSDDTIEHGIEADVRLDTISYYDDSEPNWNERPYFARVEKKRGRVGWHIDLSDEALRFEVRPDGFACTPRAGAWSSKARTQFSACIASQGYRAVLSGLGGDEAMGGVPTPLPELQDLLARVEIRSLVRQLKIWALDKRKPWLHLFVDAARAFLPTVRTSRFNPPASWIRADFVGQHRAALTGYESRLTLSGPLPSFQQNLLTLEGLRRQVAFFELPASPPYEKRYPYLDRALLEFVYAIPQTQMVRPGQRRSLMRRALVELVPEEILNRKRKAFVARAPRIAISNKLDDLIGMSQRMVASALRIVNETRFREALKNVKEDDAPIVPLIRTILVEAWLRSMNRTSLLSGLPESAEWDMPLVKSSRMASTRSLVHHEEVRTL